ncbi:MAG: hypothetical protein IJF18_06330 [Oscillospiraceae bacterium]|nr:hypothetical protein [Oscillospiraceae bacterium]
MNRLKILSAVLSCLLLAGCNQAVENVTETSFSTAGESITEAVSDTDFTEKTTVSTEINEEILDTGTTVIEEDVEIKEYPEIVVTQKELLPDNAVVYEYNSDDTPEFPDFTMELDTIENLGKYERERILAARLEIKAMLECAITGETPIIKRNGYDMPIRKLENIRIDSYKIIGESYCGDTAVYEVTAMLDVTESSVEEIDVAESQYVFINVLSEDRAYMPLRHKGGYDESRVLPLFDHEGENRAVSFCSDFTAYFSDMYAGDDVTDFSSPDVSKAENIVFYSMYAARHYYPGTDYVMSYDIFDTALKEMFGFSADVTEIKKTNCYNAEKDTVSVDGRGIGWLCGYLADKSYDEETKTHTITIDYYEDEFYLVKSQTYRYTVRENENGSLTMLRMERLFKSDRGILSGCT